MTDLTRSILATAPRDHFALSRLRSIQKIKQANINKQHIHEQASDNKGETQTGTSHSETNLHNNKHEGHTAKAQLKETADSR